MITSTHHDEKHHTRQGSILLLVLVVIMLLSFSMYSFSELSLIQYQATRLSLQETRLRLAAESGICVAVDYLKSRDTQQNATAAIDTAEDPFQHITIGSIEGVDTVCSVLKKLPQTGQAPVYGLYDESAKLNVNGLALAAEERRSSRQRLMQIPHMTNHVADAILDWMDSNDEPSDYGAESSWYASQHPAYKPRQGRLLQFSELLLVRGVTAQLLYGEDTDGNGMLSSDEDVNGDGRLQAGWSEFLTIDSAESTLRKDGRPKINLNHSNLADLYDQLEATFDANVATWVVAWRMSGREDDNDQRKELTEEEKREERASSAARRLANQLGQGPSVDDRGLRALAESDDRKVEVRNGLTLTPNAPYEIKSLLDLIGGRVRITIGIEDTLLESPWRDDPATVRRAVAELATHVTVSGSPRIRNRINVFEAPFEVLMTIPTMTESTAAAIINRRTNRGLTHSPRSIAELMERGIIDIHGLRNIAPFVTDGGDVFRAVAIGRISGENRAVGIQFAVDGTYPQPQLTKLCDLPPMPLSFDKVAN